MFHEAGVPLRVWHFGADEVPDGVWTESPLCQKFLDEHPELNGPAGLKNYFVRRMLAILERHRRERQWCFGACVEDASEEMSRGWVVSGSVLEGYGDLGSYDREVGQVSGPLGSPLVAVL